jgi:CHAD domain-containing protein
MPFRFKKSESPAKAVRRVTRERIGVARERLRDGDHSAAIHDVRREIKKLRAVFRLARGEGGQGRYRKSVKALRAAAGYLAAPRDARVMLKAFEKLTGRDARRFAAIEKMLRKHSRRETRRFQKNNFITAADRILRKIERRVGGLKIKSSGWSAIEPGLKESYSRGREACVLVRRKPVPENFHDWRKHVKNLWYYFQLLRPAWPAEARAMTDELELLAGQLGEDHDLFLLEEFVKRHCAGLAGELAALNRLIESRQEKLRAGALKLGSQLYLETPPAICRRLEIYWNSWHGK